LESGKGIRYACTGFPLITTNRKQELRIIMTSKQRSYLKSLASNLEPVLQIGKASLTPEMTEAVSEAFNTRELVKISVLKNCLDDPKAVAEALAGRTRSQVVQVIGRKIILYKESKEHKKIILPQ